MTRTLILAGLALCLGAPAFAADRDAAKDKMLDAQKELNKGKRKASTDELKAEQERTGNRDLTSMETELRNKLADLYFKLNHADAAMAQWEVAQYLDPSNGQVREHLKNLGTPAQ